MRNGLALSALVLGLVGCANTTETSNQVANQNFEATAPIDQTVDMTGRVRVRLIGINGNVAVTAVSGTEILTIGGERKVKSESTSDAQANLPNLQVEVVTSSSEVVIRTVQPQDTQGRGYEVLYQLTVPERLASAWATINGNVSVVDMASEVTANTTNGNISIDDVTGDVFAGTVNGNVDARTALVINGTVLLEAVNGNVVLDVPVTTSADVTATVVNGSITVSGLQPTNVTSTATSWSGQLGGGEGSITLGTVNGNVGLRGFQVGAVAHAP